MTQKKARPQKKSDHDGIYHQLYLNPDIMSDLLQKFVSEPWIQDLDLAHMEPIKTKFHVPGLPKRESDVVWQIPIQTGGHVYLLVMLEFQSKSDRWMILRIIIYECLLWLQLLHEKKISASGPLPPIFPMVLYNGELPWLMPIQLRDLIGLPDGSPLWEFQPDGKFFLIDATHISKEVLEKYRDSISALVFRVEQCRTPEDLIALAEEAIVWFDNHPVFSPVKQVLALMLYNVVSVLKGDQPLPLNHPINLLEVPTMLQARFEAWKEDWKEAKLKEWHKEWLHDGIQEGEKKGKAETLLQLLQERFGSVPESVQKKVTSANLDDLTAWIGKIFKADSLQAVFH
ncbi:MAG: Rpn family recombination-promoting nuclease/putative transposase [Magnetococcales bacterium]|nr:Rpn family recombination-promoting nuclease/putative transposase [Magnetococcales bacterium]